MSYQSEKEEDEVFNSLSREQRANYFREYRSTGDVRGSLDSVLGSVWFDRDGAPRGDAAGQSNFIDTATGKPVHFKTQK